MPHYLKQQKQLVDELEKSFAGNTYKSTVVDMQSDYKNDKQICLSSVAFLPDQISETIISQISSRLENIEPDQYFYKSDAMHLTIKNVRTIHNPPLFNDENIKKVKSVFKETVPRFKSIKFKVEDLILFPTSISVMAYASDELQNLVAALDKALKVKGVPDNKKYLSDSIFWGNITICRFSKKPSEKLVSAVKAMRTIKIDSFNVSEVDLITCNSVCNSSTKKLLGSYELNNA